MLGTEEQWSEALASNNIRAIIRWLQKLTADGDVDEEEILPTFSCWVQRTSEFTKKELLTLCFSRCQGLWMFLDRNSFNRVHMLLQKLRNLLTLAQWARRQLCSAHLWHGVGIPCVNCRDMYSSSDMRRSCWNQAYRTLKQHIWLGQLVQWWGIMGLLPKLPEAQEGKRITQMWKEMDHSHQKTRLETTREAAGEMRRFTSLIQGMVMQLDRQHGCMWTSEDHKDQCYPPPDLQALLKLVLVPRIDIMSVQAILMYFILDVANFLQCKDDLLQSFCNAFTISSSFSQQIRAFWMFDRGHIKASMELLLSPGTTVPCLSWQHRCIIHCLLKRKQPQVALRYLQWTRPAIETAEDAKLCADIVLQCSYVSDAWALLKKGYKESEEMYFLQVCKGFRPYAEALKYIPVGCNGEENYGGVELKKLPLMKKDSYAERPPCPLSAKLYQAQKLGTVSSEELVILVRKAVMEVRKPHSKMSVVVWPKHTERKSNSREMFLSTEALRDLMPSPSEVDMANETGKTAHTDDPGEEHPVIHNLLHETQDHTSSSEGLSSASVLSFTSASSLPLLKGDRPYVFERTLTLQRISSFLTDKENHSSEEEEEEEEEESGTPPSSDVFPGVPEQALTGDGATDSTSHSSFNKDGLIELMLSAEGGEEDFSPGKDIFSFDGPSGPSMDEKPLDTSFRLNVQSQVDSHEESQSVTDFLPNDNGATLKGPSALLNRGHQPYCNRSQTFSSSQPTTSDCYLEKELNEKAQEHHQPEEPCGCFIQDLSCPPSETTQDILTDLYQSSSLSSTSSIFPTLVKITCGSLTPSPACNIKSTSILSDTTNESSPKFTFKTHETSVPSSQAWPDHCKMDSWWIQGIETCGASSSLLSATESGAAVTSDNKRPLLLSKPYSYSLVNFMDFSAKQKGDNRDGKQAENEEPAGWSCLGKASQGAIRSGRTQSRKGKRLKRT